MKAEGGRLKAGFGFRPSAFRRCFSTFSLLPSAFVLLSCEQGIPADMVLVDGDIITMDPALPRAEALAIRGGQVVYVGSSAGARGRIGPSTRVIPLAGRTVLPGFHDAHVHPVTGGTELLQCDLTGLETADTILVHIAACAAALPESAWVIGSGWELPIFPDANPSRLALDSVTAGRPASFSAADGHSAWVNSAALAQAGVTAETEDPPGGRIERDRRGEPSGTLRETAIGLVSDSIPPADPASRRDGLRAALTRFAALGITAVQEASANRTLLEVYRDLDRAGGLTARVVVAMRADPGRDLAAQVDTFALWRRTFGSDRLRATAVKIFVDGVIEARTAAMLSPYTDQPGRSGEPRWSPDRLDSMVALAVDSGFSVHLHAIGDRAVRMALDAIAHAESGRERGGRRHQIAHLEVIDSTDVPRFAALDVVANFQPLWAWPDSYIRDLTWPALGPERSRWLYPIGAVERAGGRLAFGSDWNVSSANPLEGIETAVTRRDPRDPEGPQLLPEQAINRQTALKAYTAGSAWAMGLDGVSGQLRAGLWADLVILGRPLAAVRQEETGEVSVLLTLLAGQPVHGSLDSLQPD